MPERLGKYEIRGVLGKGAMGTVYDGWDPMIDRRVAIKTVRLPNAEDEEAIEGLARFKREAQAAGRLTHPNIVGVFDYGETAQLAFIVMEFVEGRSLKEILGGQERMVPQEALRLMTEVLAGLAYSHGRGVVHRDIKPANVMVTREGQAKIADFGIARIEASSMTQAGTIMGTPAYMSPEQFMGQVVDLRTDIYSCGVMLYQLLTGERPFEGSMTSIMHKAMTTTPPRPSELAVTAPAQLDPVVAKAMARRPEDRFESAPAFSQALLAPPGALAVDPLNDPLAGDETVVAPRARPAPTPVPVPATPPAPPPQAARPGGRMPLVLGGVAVALALAGGGAWFLLPGTPAPEAPRVTATVPPPVVPPPQMPAPSAPVQAPAQQAAIPDPPAPQQQTAAAGPAPAIVVPPPVPLAPAAAPLIPQRLPAAIASALAAALPTLGCTAATATVSATGVATVGGLAGAGPPTSLLRAAVQSANPAETSWQVHPVDGPFCPVLDLVRAQAEAGFRLEQQGGPAPLSDNQVIDLRATMPFAGWLHVAYLQHDQTVSPLVPGPGYPLQTYAARTVIPLGQPRRDFPGWLVGPPFGTDMILAVASTAPLFDKPLPDGQSQAAYLASLQAAMEAVRRRGGMVAAQALVLDTRPGR